VIKVNVYSVKGEKGGQVELPIQFLEPVRFDLIKRSILSVHSRKRQAHGADPLAGTRQGNATSKRRQRYKTTYGARPGQSRIKRKYSFHQGRQFGWIGAFVASAISGRRAFPPTSAKNIVENINKKENRKAIRSAMAANAETIKVIDDKFMNLKKTQEVQKFFEKLGLKDEIAKSKDKKIRAGKGTMRGRKYVRRKGALVVVAQETLATKAVNNIPGIDVVNVKRLNADILCPGIRPRRNSIWTKESLETLKKERLYM
jgi:large subunit ribosomal protein L4e